MYWSPGLAVEVDTGVVTSTSVVTVDLPLGRSEVAFGVVAVMVVLFTTLKVAASRLFPLGATKATFSTREPPSSVKPDPVMVTALLVVLRPLSGATLVTAGPAWRKKVSLASLAVRLAVAVGGVKV